MSAAEDRIAFDLLLQMPGGFEPSDIWVLGCGTGAHAALLARRRPDAMVHGLEAHEALLNQARARPERVDWVSGEAEDFSPATPPDLIFSAAAWSARANHKALMPRLFRALKPGGVLACAVRSTPGGPDMADYHHWLSPGAAEMLVWKTAYFEAPEVSPDLELQIDPPAYIFVIARR